MKHFSFLKLFSSRPNKLAALIPTKLYCIALHCIAFVRKIPKLQPPAIHNTMEWLNTGVKVNIKPTFTKRINIQLNGGTSVFLGYHGVTKRKSKKICKYAKFQKRYK